MLGSAFLRPDLLYAFAYLLCFVYLRVTGRSTLWRMLVLSLGFAAAWTLLAAPLYGYQARYLSLGPVSLYPLATWSVGLFLVRLLVEPEGKATGPRNGGFVQGPGLLDRCRRP